MDAPNVIPEPKPLDLEVQQNFIIMYSDEHHSSLSYKTVSYPVVTVTFGAGLAAEESADKLKPPRPPPPPAELALGAAKVNPPVVPTISDRIHNSII